MSSTAKASAKTERPRKRSRSRSADNTGDNPRDEIIKAATELFRTGGYASVSMTSIARAVNLDQSSLYYWFKSKEQILDAVVIYSFETCPLRGKIFKADAPACVRLFSLLYRRTFKYCNLPIGVFDIEVAADRKPGLFEQFFTELETYKLNLHSLLKEGIQSGDFIDLDDVEATHLALSFVLSQQQLFHRQTAGHSMTLAADKDPKPQSVHEWSIQTARIATSMFVGSNANIDEIEEQARERGWLSGA